MADERPYFTPEHVEEQVAWLRRQPPGQADDDERRLVEDVQRLYQRQRADERSLEAVRARLESRGVLAGGPRQRRPDESGHRGAPSGRTGRSSPRPRRSLAARFGAVAAAVLLLVVVAGLVAGLVLFSHQRSVTGRPTAIVRACGPTATGGTTSTFPPGPPAVYAISNNTTVVALDPLTGSLLWQQSFPNLLNLFIRTVQDQTMYIEKDSRQGTTLSALSAKNGAERWEIPLPQEGPILTKTLILVSSGTLVQAWDLQTGAARWTWQGPPAGITELSAEEAGDAVYSTEFDGQGGSTTYAINATTGKECWRIQGSVVAAIDQTVYVTKETPSGPIFTALNASDGTERWQMQGAGQKLDWSSPTILNGVVYLPYSDANISPNTNGDRGGQGVLYALRESDGKELWHTSPSQDGPAFSSATLGQNTAYVSDGKGVYAFNQQNGQQRWHTRSGGTNTIAIPALSYGLILMEQPVLDNGLVFMTWLGASPTPGNQTDFLSVLDATTGGERWHYLADDYTPPTNEPGYEPGTVPPLIGDGIVLLRITTGDPVSTTFQALRASDGTPLWRNSTLSTLIVCTGGVASSCAGQPGWG